MTGRPLYKWTAYGIVSALCLAASALCSWVGYVVVKMEDLEGL